MRRPREKFLIHYHALTCLNFDFSNPTASTSRGLHPTDSTESKVEIDRVHNILLENSKGPPEPVEAEVLPITDPHTVLISQMRNNFRYISCTIRFFLRYLPT